MNRFLRIAGAVMLLALAAPVSAHDFWLQPERWRLDPATSVELSILVGHGADRQRSPIRASRIVRFEAIAPDGRRIDLRAQLHTGGPIGDTTIALRNPGSYMLVLETDDRAESHLPADRFNTYLHDEGLTAALELRTRTNRSGADGAENYSRHAKTILQVGPFDPHLRSAVARPTGMALEIVPERNPLAASGSKDLVMRVYYRGRPLAGALVKLNDLNHDASPVAMRRSDGNGRAVFASPGPGDWQMNVIWTRPQPRNRLTDFATSFSSLSFGIPAR